MAVQNIRIKYVVDTADLSKADKSIDNLTDSEKKLKEEFDKANKSADKSFKTIEDGAKKSGTEVNNLGTTIKTIGGVVAAAFAVEKIISFGAKVIEVRGQFEKLEAVLTNTLGSKSIAKVALAEITEVAAKTNFGVLELTQSYVKLANQGFKPTAQELIKLSDVANSTGKSFDQLTEAIIDAQTGEFERLKEFGIRASKSGDQVKFTFKGVETQTKFTSSAIREYILGLGDLNGVQGATAAISQTLEGRISNLGDSFDQFLNVIGERLAPIIGGAIGLLSNLVEFATDAVTSLDQAISKRNTEELKKGIGEDKEAVEDLVITYEYAGLKITEATRRATIDIILDLEKRKAAAIQNGADFTSQEVNGYRTRIEALERYLADVNKKAEEAAKADEKAAQEARDKAYKIALDDLAERERNTLRIAKVEGMSKVYLLDVERRYNVERVNLFKQYNQQNLEELRGYNIKFRELNKETKEARLQNNVDYAKLESQKIDITSKTEGIINNITLQTSIDNVKKYREDEEAFKRSQERKREIAYAFVSGLTQLYNTFQENQRIQNQQDIAQNGVNRQQELRAFEGNKQAQATINAKYDQQERRLKREQAQRDKEATLFNMAINIASAVVEALPNYVLAAVVAGFGAIQLGIVASRPLPKFKDGVERLTGEGTETSDSILARLSVNERVVDAKTNKDYFPALHAIHNRHIPPELLNNMVMNYDRVQPTSSQIFINDNSAVVSKLDKVAQKLDNLKQVNVSIDKNGIHAHLESKYERTEFANNYLNL